MLGAIVLETMMVKSPLELKMLVATGIHFSMGMSMLVAMRT